MSNEFDLGQWALTNDFDLFICLSVCVQPVEVPSLSDGLTRVRLQVHPLGHTHLQRKCKSQEEKKCNEK